MVRLKPAGCWVGYPLPNKAKTSTKSRGYADCCELSITQHSIVYPTEDRV
jgi:hypothetical protein